MSKKKFSFIDLADDLYVEENIINSEKEDEIIDNFEKPKIIKDDIKEQEEKIIINDVKKIENKNERKISNNVFFKEKEKLDIKTNIYLKKEIYQKIEQIYRSTGNSRSSIINKLIEIALDKIEEN